MTFDVLLLGTRGIVASTSAAVKEEPLPGGMGRGIAFSARGVGAVLTQVCPHL